MSSPSSGTLPQPRRAFLLAGLGLHGACWAVLLVAMTWGIPRLSAMWDAYGILRSHSAKVVFAISNLFVQGLVLILPLFLLGLLIDARCMARMRGSNFWSWLALGALFPLGVVFVSSFPFIITYANLDNLR